MSLRTTTTTSTSTVGLLEPFLTGGVRSTNFFNGRLLSGEDLTAEQQASQQARALLGAALGDGIAFGLEVRASRAGGAPAVTVYPGVAINRLGHVLALNAPATGIDVTLTPPAATDATALPNLASAPFRACLPPQAGVYVAGTLVYLLVITPAAGAGGLAPASGFGGVAATCTTRYTVEGVQFRLLQLDVSADTLNDPAHLRNLAAHACFGTSDPTLLALRGDPFGPADGTGYGLVDKLRLDGRLTDCDVPLAILHWTAPGAVDFVDMWPARRRLVRRPTTTQWPLAVDERRLAEAEAIVLEFQEHLASLRDAVPSPPSLAATDAFRYLPPVGFLPVSGVGAAPSFSYPVFFGPPVAYRGPAVIEGAGVEPLVRAALTCAPVDLWDNPLVWLYQVRENQPLPGGTGSAPTPYLMFTSGHIPFQGQTRFDEGRWEYGTYG